MNLYNVFFREYQIIRFSVEVETEGDWRAAIGRKNRLWAIRSAALGTSGDGN